MADALGVPAAFLFASDERLARLILAFTALPEKAQARAVTELEIMAQTQRSR